MTDPVRYAYSTDEERYHLADDGVSREDAIAECIRERDLKPGDRLWTASIEAPPKLSEFLPDVDWFIETLSERAHDSDYGATELTDDFLEGVPKEAKIALEEKLAALINAWAEEHGLQPKFFLVDSMSVELFEVP